MANVTIPDLSSAATIDGSELLECSQSAASKKVTVANLVPGLTTIVSALWTVSLSIAAESGHKRVVTATLKDLNNVTLASAKLLGFALASTATAYAVSDEGAGTGLTTGANNVSQFTTHTDGTAAIGFTDANAETLKVVFFTPQGPVIASLTFAG